MTWLVSLCVFLPACYRVPLSRTPLPELLNPIEFVRSANQNYGTVKDMTIQCRITVSSARGSVTYRSILQCKVPTNLRIITLGLLAHPTFIATTDGSTLSVAVPSDGKYYYGSAHPEKIEKIFGLPLSVAEIIDIMYGAPVRDITDVQCHQDSHLYQCEVTTPRGLSTVWIDPRRQVITRYHTTVSYEKHFQIIFDDYRPVEGKFIPFSISIRCPSEKLSLLIRYASVATDVLTSDVFQQSIPASQALPLELLPQLW